MRAKKITRDMATKPLSTLVENSFEITWEPQVSRKFADELDHQNEEFKATDPYPALPTLRTASLDCCSPLLHSVAQPAVERGHSVEKAFEPRRLAADCRHQSGSRLPQFRWDCLLSLTKRAGTFTLHESLSILSVSALDVCRDR